MGLVETEALILRTYKLAEADKVVLCLTKQEGLVRGVAPGARRLKSRFGASLEPFTHVALTYFEKEGRELVSIKQAEIIRSVFELARQAEAVATLEYWAHLAVEFAAPHQSDERLFRMVRACVEAAAREPAQLATLTLYYELWMLKISGFLPEHRACGTCLRPFASDVEPVSLSFEGVLRCGACRREGEPLLEPPLYLRLRRMRAQGPGEWARACALLPEELRGELGRINRRLLTRALEREPRARGAQAQGAG